ncbi:MMPL family transporter [Pseudoclavibacter helvolus]|uniref:MMPL family transporter n=1 Tax=Pseudoclavibacter helvolus TaxID=255205 RepID=UPI003C71427D
MALLLFRIARGSYRRPWRVLGAWVLLLGVALGVGLGAGGTLKESFAIPGTQSQAALDRLGEVFPEAAGASASVVVVAPEGESVEDAASKDAIDAAADRLGELDGVSQALSPFSEYATDAVSDDGQAGIIRVQFDGTSEDISEELVVEVTEIGTSLESAGLQVGFDGQIFQNLEYGLTPTEIVGVVFAAIVLLVTFGSVLAAGLPLASAIVGVGVTMGGILFAAKFVVVSSATPLLAVMIGLAVGIDYALFVVSRHRTQLANGMDAEESTATAVGTAGNAVVFAGVTVMIALLGLMIVGIPFLSVMGIAAAAAVFAAMAAVVTLVPALLGFAGERMRPKAGSRAFRRETGADAKPTIGRRWVRLVMRAPLAFALAVVAILGTLAIPALDLKLALPSGASEPEDSVAHVGYDLVSEHFGPGANGPLIVMVDITQGDNETLLDDLQLIADRVAEVDGVDTVGDPLPNLTIDSAIIQVVPSTGPDDDETLRVVGEIRDLGDELEAETGMVTSVTGATAIALDISDRLNRALLPFAAVVVGLSFFLLMMVFRSILVPLKAALSFLLSVFAAFGVVVAIFQWGWFADALHVVPGPIISFMPILLMAIIFGLAMDYEVFLVSGMREAYVRSGNARDAVETGFANGARVVTAAALIMFFVFAAFVPEGAGVIKAIALGLAAGIFFDAFLVRMTLVPAIMTMLGSRAWTLPRWLDRILPDLDVEGEHLRHYRQNVEWMQGQQDGIAMASLVAGTESNATRPVTGGIGRGGVLLVEGRLAERRLLAATLAGRIAPVSGHAHAHGHLTPGDEGALMRRVAVVDAATLDARSAELTVGALLEERLRLGRGSVAGPVPEALIQQGVAELAAAATRLRDGSPGVRAGTTLGELRPAARGVALARIALAERPEVLILDLGPGADPESTTRLAGALLAETSALAPADTTLVLGLPAGLDAASIVGKVRRPAGRIRLDAPPRASADASAQDLEATSTHKGALA